MWSRLQGWLNNTSVTDPVDKHYVSFMQLLLAAVGIVVPTIKLATYVAVKVGGAKSYDSEIILIIDIGTDALITASAWLGIFLVRRGHIRQALLQFLGVLLGTLLIAYLTPDVKQPAGDPTSWIVLALAGQIMGRKALWMAYLALLLCVAVGVLRLAFGHETASVLPALMLGIERAMILLLIAVIVDQTMAPLRAALTESTLRQRELADVNASLAQEIVEREKAQDHLIHVQKLDAVGRIATGVAHDFDNVLNVILGYVTYREQLAERGIAAMEGAMEDIEIQVRRALSISRKLLNFGRKDVSRSEIFDIAKATLEFQPMLRQFFTPRTRVRIRADDDVMLVRMDRGQYELTLLNMASNAADAMPHGGEFTIRITRDVDQRHVVLELEDTGNGMDEEIARRVFEPFYTTKPWGYGTGLGLSAVHEILTGAGGTVTVASQPGKGTTFEICLPLVDDQPMNGIASTSSE